MRVSFSWGRHEGRPRDALRAPWATAAALLFAAPVLAVGADDDAPPPTNPAFACAEGLIWDAETRACVAPEEASVSDDTRYAAVRLLAYQGRNAEAQQVLATMTDQTEDRVLTYWGFTHGRNGDLETGLRYYRQALDRNPDNILARSYMGQALIAAGRPREARRELAEIRARGGAGGWAERSLAEALETGRGYAY